MIGAWYNSDSPEEGWVIAGSRERIGGKSGHRRTGWWITSTGREVRDSATESKQPGEPSAISLQPSVTTTTLKANG
jgi:hypothetical protein